MSSRARIRPVPEAKLQASIVAYLRFQLPRAVVAHVPNGGRRDPREARNLVTQGVVAGFPDLIILYRSRVYLLEVKNEAGRLSDSQRTFEAWCASADGGFDHAVVRSVGDVAAALRAWGLLGGR